MRQLSLHVPSYFDIRRAVPKVSDGLVLYRSLAAVSPPYNAVDREKRPWQIAANGSKPYRASLNLFLCLESKRSYSIPHASKPASTRMIDWHLANNYFTNKLDVSFSNAKYRDNASMVGLALVGTFWHGSHPITGWGIQANHAGTGRLFTSVRLNTWTQERRGKIKISLSYKFFYLVVIRAKSSLLIVIPPSILISPWLWILELYTISRKLR